MTLLRYLFVGFMLPCLAQASWFSVVKEDSAAPEEENPPAVRRFIDMPEGGLSALVKTDEYQPDTQPKGLAENQFLTIPIDILKMIANHMPRQLAFLSTCRTLRNRVEPSRELIITLPHDFTRSQTFQLVQAGQKPLKWADKVTAICLYQLSERKIMIDKEGYVKDAPDFMEKFGLYMKEIISPFPNVKEVIDDPCFGEYQYSQHKLSCAIQTFVPRIPLNSFCYKKIPLNHRRLQLCFKLYVEWKERRKPVRYEGLTVGPFNLPIVVNDTIVRELSMERFLQTHGKDGFGISIPFPTLNQALDLFEEFEDKNRPQPHCYDDRFRLFLRDLSQRPELWSLMRSIHKNLWPITDIIDSGFFCGDQDRYSHDTLIQFCNEAQRSNGPQFIEAIATYLSDIESLFRSVRLNRVPNVAAITRAIANLGKERIFQGQMERLFHRFSVVFKAKALMMDKKYAYPGSYDEPDSDPLKSEQIEFALQKVHKHLSEFNDVQLEAIGRLAVERFYIRRTDILQDWHWEKMLQAIQAYRGRN